MTISRFKNTKNKEIVRTIDKKYISELYREYQRKLTYFGLPGKDILDILNWREYIGCVHAVERGKEERIGIQKRLTEFKFEKNAAIYPFELGELLRNQALCDHLLKYELVNFDFEGVLVSNKKTEKSYKIKENSTGIIKNMLELQKGKFNFNEKWIFLLTFYATRNSTKELDTFIDDMIEALPNISLLQNSNIDEICNYLKNQNTKQGAKMAVIIPIWLLQECGGFDIEVKEICYYYGSNNSPMIHFVFLIIERKRSMQNLLNIEKIKEIPLQKIKCIKNGEVETNNLGIPIFERKEY